GSALQVDEAMGLTRAADRPASTPLAGTLADAERAHIIGVLDACHWILEGPGQAADRLGLRPSTLRSRMQKLRIRRPGGGRGGSPGAGPRPPPGTRAGAG